MENKRKKCKLYVRLFTDKKCKNEVSYNGYKPKKIKFAKLINGDKDHDYINFAICNDDIRFSIQSVGIFVDDLLIYKFKINNNEVVISKYIAPSFHPGNIRINID
jgi:hypothetical protein